MDVWMDGWMDGWVDGWMYGCMDGWIEVDIDGWINIASKLKHETLFGLLPGIYFTRHFD